MSAGRNVNSNSQSWSTPEKYVKLVLDFFKTIDLDPCSNEYSIVPANTKYILPTDGLVESWDF